MDMKDLLIALAALAGSGLAAVAAHFLADAMRLGEMAGRIALTTFLVVLSVSVCWLGGWMPRLGVDLSGGVVMVWEIDDAKTQDKTITSENLKAPLTRRLNPGGIKELTIRPFGEKRIEIIIPRAEREELEQLKKLITQAGFLEFRILADPQVDFGPIKLATANSNIAEKIVHNETGKPVGQWVKVGREEPGPKDKDTKVALPYRQYVLGEIIRDAKTGRVITDAEKEVIRAEVEAQTGKTQQTKKKDNAFTRALDAALRKRGVEDLEILVLIDEFNVKGTDLAKASLGYGESGDPEIDFEMNAEGALKFGGLTGSNLPKGNQFRSLCIILDNNLISSAHIQSVITDRGRITGRFSKQEVEYMVNLLMAGRLPAVLRDQPISQEEISPLLGQDTIDKGRWAVVISLAAVIVFMVGYYNFAGAVASFALLLNLLFTVALMILFKARLTLPGMAGLVLTVGMSVDANVLIYERIRDELNSGTGLRMAIRNGFARALSAIVDGNVTTILTAVVLYVIGTDTIRGFAVTTILGIATSMFTAIYVARLVFDVWEKKGWLPSLSFHQIFGKLDVDFFAIRWQMIGFSMVLIVAGLIIAVLRGDNMLDTDLSGGYSIQILTKSEMTPDQVRQAVEKEFPNSTVTGMRVTKLENRVYKIDVPIIRTTEQGGRWKPVDIDHYPTFEELVAFVAKDELPRTKIGTGSPVLPSGTAVTEILLAKKVFPDQLATRTMSYAFESEKPAAAAIVPAVPLRPMTPGTGPVPAPTPPLPMPAPGKEPPPAKTTPEVPEPKGTEEPKATPPEPKATPEGKPAKEPENKQARRSGLSTPVLFQEPAADPKAAPPAEPKNDPEAKTPADPKAEIPPVETPAPVSPAPVGPLPTAPGPMSPAPMTPGVDTTHFRSTFKLTLGDAKNLDDTVRGNLSKINRDTLKVEFEQAARAGLGVSNLDIELETLDRSNETAARGSADWTVTLPLGKEDGTQVMEAFQKDYMSQVVFPSSSEIGGAVAGNTQGLAIAALIISWIGMIAYLWFRFQKIMYGIAAVVALVHDVLIALFGLAISVYLAPYLGFLQMEDFKISLAVIAALLTIVGYSVNDTIVIFDRIREVRGKLPVLTIDMVNDSINATMSRTILTSLTVFMVVLILYFFGGAAIHAFAFTMVVGVIAGSYSTIYIAAPLLLMFEEAEGTGPSKAPPSAPRPERVPV